MTNELLKVQPERCKLLHLNLISVQAAYIAAQAGRVYAVLGRLTRKLLQFGMHFEIMSFKLCLFIEGLAAILTSVQRMFYAIMLLPFRFRVEDLATYLTFILVFSHMIFSFQQFVWYW
jgi:hypothetical protein